LFSKKDNFITNIITSGQSEENNSLALEEISGGHILPGERVGSLEGGVPDTGLEDDLGHNSANGGGSDNDSGAHSNIMDYFNSFK
jgi:hypothetical protein